MNVKEFKIHLTRGLMRPEYFYIPLLEHGKELCIFIHKVDQSGNYLAGAVIRIEAQGSAALVDAIVEGAEKTDEYAGSDYSYIYIKTLSSRIKISGLEAADYYVREDSAPMLYNTGSITPTNAFHLLSDGSCVSMYYPYSVVENNLLTVTNRLKNAISFIVSRISNPVQNKNQSHIYIRDYIRWEGKIDYGVSRYMYSVGLVEEDGTDNTLFRTDWWTEYEFDDWSDVKYTYAVKIYDKGVYKGYFMPVDCRADKYEDYRVNDLFTDRGVSWDNILEYLDRRFGPEATDIEYAKRGNDFFPVKKWREPPPNYRYPLDSYRRYDAVESALDIRHQRTEGQSPWEIKYGEPAQLGEYGSFTDENGNSASVSFTEMTDITKRKPYRVTREVSGNRKRLFKPMSQEIRTIIPASNLALVDGVFTPTHYPGADKTETGIYNDYIDMVVDNVPTADTMPDYNDIELSITYDERGEVVISGGGECFYYGDGLTKEQLSAYQIMFGNNRGSNGESIYCGTDVTDYPD